MRFFVALDIPEDVRSAILAHSSPSCALLAEMRAGCESKAFTSR